jgi:DNA-binding HxlR family transcriptional regulator
MKGTWFWPEEPKAQARVLRTVRGDKHLPMILAALAKSKDGLSNAQIDNMLANNSQWITARHLGKLMALGFVEYEVEIFGDAGMYTLTELGKTVLPTITGQ